MDDFEKILIELADAFGPSGFEKDVRNVFEKWVADDAEVTYDNLGSIIARHSGSSDQPKILLAAHLDEVGLMVRGILPGGQLRVVSLGSWWTPALIAQPVIVRTRNGDHYGVVGAKPPHHLKDDEKNRQLKIEELYIDMGARNSEEVSGLGIEVGNPVIPAVSARRLSLESMLMGKAFDDRVGCAAIIQTLRELDHQHPNLVLGVGTVQEENGLKGAKSIAKLIQPDICIILEGIPADDFPDSGAIVQGRLGQGPQIRRYDPTLIANQALVNFVIEQAEQIKIPYQIAVRESGGTDGSAIQVETTGGVPTTVIGVPVRYAHSHHGIVNLKDLGATIKLLRSLIYRLDINTVIEIKRNPW